RCRSVRAAVQPRSSGRRPARRLKRQLMTVPSTRPRVAFLVNGEHSSAMGHRARAFAARLGDHFDIHISYRPRRKMRALVDFFLALRRLRPAVTYVFDMGFAGVGGANLHKALGGSRLVIETGDAIAELTAALGRGPLGRYLTRCLEDYALDVADRLVVR